MRFGCGYAHTLSELRIGPMEQQRRYERGQMCRFIGQTMSEESHRLILSYFDAEARRGRDSPAWAHCYVWAYRQWPLDYRRDLGDFGLREDYWDWVLEQWRDDCGYHPFPGWLSGLLELRREVMSLLPEDEGTSMVLNRIERTETVEDWVYEEEAELRRVWRRERQSRRRGYVEAGSSDSLNEWNRGGAA